MWSCATPGCWMAWAAMERSNGCSSSFMRHRVPTTKATTTAPMPPPSKMCFGLGAQTVRDVSGGWPCQGRSSWLSPRPEAAAAPSKLEAACASPKGRAAVTRMGSSVAS